MRSDINREANACNVTRDGGGYPWSVRKRKGWQGTRDQQSDLSRLLISEKTEYESRAIVYYRSRNRWDYSCCVKLNRPAAAVRRGM